MNNKIKVLFVHQDLGVGGAEQNRLVTLKYLNRDKFDVTVCCIEDKGVIGDEIERLGFKIIEFKKHCSILNPLITFKLLRLMVREKFDIVHTSLFYANFHGRVAARLAGVPAIFSEEQNIYEWKNIHPSFIVADRILAKFTTKIIAVSEAVKLFTSRQEGIGQERFAVVHNSFDQEKFELDCDMMQLRNTYKFRTDEKLIGCVASLSKQKGHIFLLRSMKEVLKSVPSCKLLLIGGGELKETLIEEARELGIEERVIFMGTRRDIPCLVRLLDVFVFPSLWEGLPIALIEAMFAQRPIVASDLPSISELICDGTGVLVPARDSSALASAIVRLLKDDSGAKQMGMRARQRVLDKFSPRSYISKLENLYESGLKKLVKRIS